MKKKKDVWFCFWQWNVLYLGYAHNFALVSSVLLIFEHLTKGKCWGILHILCLICFVGMGECLTTWSSHSENLHLLRSEAWKEAAGSGLLTQGESESLLIPVSRTRARETAWLLLASLVVLSSLRGGGLPHTSVTIPHTSLQRSSPSRQPVSQFLQGAVPSWQSGEKYVLGSVWLIIHQCLQGRGPWFWSLQQLAWALKHTLWLPFYLSVKSWNWHLLVIKLFIPFKPNHSAFNFLTCRGSGFRRLAKCSTK